MRTAILHVIYAILIVAALYVAYDMGRYEAAKMEMVR